MNKIIGIDVYSALHYPRGMGIYTIFLLRGLAKIDKETKYILYADVPDSENILPKQDNFEFKILPAKGIFDYEQFILPKECKKDNIYALHSPAITSPFVLDKKIKRIVTQHDVIFLKLQVPFSINKKHILGRFYYSLCSLFNTTKADFIITPSEFSKNDIIKELHIDKNKIIVDTRGAEHFDVSSITPYEELKNKYNIPKEYFFHIGGEAPTKNSKTVLELFSKKPDINIVFAGIKKLDSSYLYKKFKKYQNITFVPYISQADIVGLYQNALGFIVPSFYEGFGLPILEAMKSSCPIICSNATCLPEVAGNATIYFNPHNKNELYDKIIQIKNNQGLREELIQKGKERLELFSWDKMADITLDVYKRV